MKTDQHTYTIILGKEDAQIGEEFYEIWNDNLLYDLIRQEDFDCAPIVQ